MADIARKGDQEVRLVDPTSQTPVNVTSDGRLLVSQELSAPADTTPIKRVVQGDISTTTDDTFTITNGKMLTIQRVQAGSEQNTTGGSKVELLDDPNGDLSVLNLIAVVYVNGDSNQLDVGETFTGDGTRRIILRRDVFGGGAREIFARWDGFEQ